MLALKQRIRSSMGAENCRSILALFCIVWSAFQREKGTDEAREKRTSTWHIRALDYTCTEEIGACMVLPTSVLIILLLPWGFACSYPFAAVSLVLALSPLMAVQRVSLPSPLWSESVCRLSRFIGRAQRVLSDIQFRCPLVCTVCERYSRRNANRI